MRNLILALAALLLLPSVAWGVADIITIAGPCTMALITDATDSGVGDCLITGGTPSAEDTFIVKGGTSEKGNFAITGATGNVVLTFAPPGETARVTESMDITLTAPALNGLMRKAFSNDLMIGVGWTGTADDLDIEFGGDWANRAAGSYLTCVASGGDAACAAYSEDTPAVVVPDDYGQLTITGDWVANTTATAYLQVRGGASLTIDTENEVRFTAGRGGAIGPFSVDTALDIWSGATVNMNANWYSWGESTADMYDDPVGHEWPVGQVVPCAKAGTTAQSIVSDCSSAAKVMGIRYGDEWQPNDATDNTDPDIAASLTQVAADVAGGQVVLTFVDHSWGTAQDIANDVNASYEVTAADTVGANARTDAGSIRFDLHQGEFDQTGWPEARINIVGTSVLAGTSAAAGTRTVQVAATTLAVAPLSLVDAADGYKWVVSGVYANAYYLTTTGDADPGLKVPSFVTENAGVTPVKLSMDAGAPGVGEWVWNDLESGPALGYKTIYVKLTDSADPEGKADGYITMDKADKFDYAGRWIRFSDGVLTPGTSIVLTNTGELLTRTVGSFIDEGFAVGQTVTMTGSASSDGALVVTALTALVMTVTSNEITADEGAQTDLVLNTPDAAECQSYMVERIDHNASGDIVTISDVRGFPKTYGATSVAFLDNGMKCGETFVLTHAIEIESATPINIGDPTDNSDSNIVNRGTLTMKGVRMLGIPRFYSFQAPDAEMSYGGMYDSGWSASSGIVMNIFNSKRFQIGPSWGLFVGIADKTMTGQHGVMSSNNELLIVRDHSSRGVGDDHLLCNSFATEHTGEFRIERSILEWTNDDGDSAAGIDSIGKCGINVDGALFIRPSDPVGTNGVIGLSNPQGKCRLNEVEIMSTESAPFSLAANAATSVDCVGTNWLVSGVRLNQKTSGSQVPPVVNHFVSRDSDYAVSNGGTGYAGTNGRSTKNGYFDRINLNTGVFNGFTRSPYKWENVGIFDHNVSADTGVTIAAINNTSVSATNFDANKITVAWRPGTSTEAAYGFYTSSDSAVRGTWSNLVIANMHDACGTSENGGAIRVHGAAAWDLSVGGWWNIFNNDTCASSTWPTVLNLDGGPHTGLDTALVAAGGGLRQRDPMFYSPTNGQFWPVKDSFNQINGVGMQKGAGVCKKTWPMKVKDTAPECQGDGNSGGVGSWPDSF